MPSPAQMPMRGPMPSGLPAAMPRPPQQTMPMPAPMPTRGGMPAPSPMQGMTGPSSMRTPGPVPTAAQRPTTQMTPMQRPMPYAYGGIIGLADGGSVPAPVPTYNPAYIGGREGAAPIPGMYDPPPPPESSSVPASAPPTYSPEQMAFLMRRLRKPKPAGKPRYASGGLIGLAYGGMLGDGLSDSVPAMANGNQPVNLSNGEFVVPSDVVSGIGNGSTEAGAGQLYDMMNRVRQARSGTMMAPNQVNPQTVMPR